MPDQEMIDRCKNALALRFAPAIGFKAPYAKVMLDMAITDIIQAMREPTEGMLKAEGVHTKCYTCGGHKEGYQNMIDSILNA